MPELILDDLNFDAEVLKSEVPVLVDFFATWCGPCKIQGPIIEELARDFANKNIKIGKLNVDVAADTAGKFNILSIPTLLIFKGGQVVETLIGLQSKKILADKLMKIID